MGNVDLSSAMPWHGYLVLIAMGVLASCALVVPGISGSMLLLIFGYYEPILGMISGLRTDFGHSLLVLVIFALGVVVGFFTIAKLMKLLLNKFHRSTMWAIVGFVIGSIPAVIITFFHEYGVAYLDTLQICLGVATFIIGAIATYFIALYAKKKQAQTEVEEVAISIEDEEITQTKTEE